MEVSHVNRPVVNAPQGAYMQTSQDRRAMYGLPSSFTELLTKGKELPLKIRELFFGFDFEIQLARLDIFVIDYLSTAFEEISELALKYLEIEDGVYSDKKERIEWFKREIRYINSEVKVLVRGYRAIDGFTIIEGGTIRSHAESINEERNRERRGFLKNLFNKGV